MKKSIILCVCSFLMCALHAQPPQKISYQSIVRNADDELITNGMVGVRFTITLDAPEGDVVYTETHTGMTNENGLLTLIIGEGENGGSDLDEVDWGLGAHFLQVDIDPDGGSNYTIMGNSELLSVPYALYAPTSGGDGDWVEDVPNNVVYTERSIALQQGGTEPFRVNAADMVNAPRVYALTDQGYALQGMSTNFGTGVRGESLNGPGVVGISDRIEGVRGESEKDNGVIGVSNTDGSGVRGISDNGPGVSGTSNSSPGVEGDSDLDAGVKGTSQDAAGVEGFSDQEVGVLGSSTTTHGVKGISSITNISGVFGEATDAAIGVEGVGVDNVGVRGRSENKTGVSGSTLGEAQEILDPGNIGRGTNQIGGVSGSGTDNAYGVYGSSINRSGVMASSEKSNGVSGGTVTEQKDRAGVYGGATKTHGVYGRSIESNGVYGRTNATEMDITAPGAVMLFNQDNKVGVLGTGEGTFGTVGSSSGNAGVLGVSGQSNGVTGTTGSDAEDRAGVAGLAQSTAGVLGWSESGSGVRGKSNTGAAGEFEGEVHIENGMKNAKLKIEMMEDDPTAPCLVWSGDQYVRKRECWTIEEDNGLDYFVSNKGIKIKTGDETVFQVNPDGTSIHKGIEVFEAGIRIPGVNNTYIDISPDNGVSIIDRTTFGFYFHANLFGQGLFFNALTTNAFTANTIVANSKQFRIDHPLDPENKYLMHTSMESDQRINVYSGNVITDSQGAAIVELPEWMEALNTDFRYQLTVIGSFAQAMIAEEISENQFKIMTNEPSVKVSWQVTGRRHDTWAQENPNDIEVLKKEYSKPDVVVPEPR